MALTAEQFVPVSYHVSLFLAFQSCKGRVAELNRHSLVWVHQLLSPAQIQFGS